MNEFSYNLHRRLPIHTILVGLRHRLRQRPRRTIPRSLKLHLQTLLESTNQSPLATSASSPDLAKIQSFLASSSSGTLSCLICLEQLKLSDPTWHCSAICYLIFHLICIQSWARFARAIHRGPCIETCTIVITKLRLCGSLMKEIWRVKGSVKRMRDCGWHACKHRCCDACHVRRGASAPCPLMVTISCTCGETLFEVPCGTERDQKPAKCRNSCHITPLCRHRSICKPHKCHYGPFPPCRLICVEEYP